MSPIPLLIISDAPSSGSGLGRITKDLALRIAKNMPEFRVGTLGHCGLSTRSLPFQQYIIEGMSDWVIPTLPDVWADFAGNERGIILTIWDASRLGWFGLPETCQNPVLKNFLQSGIVQRWGYFPMDASGPNGKLSTDLNDIINGFDRILAYSKWAADILDRSTPEKAPHDFLPHGIDRNIFVQRPRVQARHSFGQRLGFKTEKGNWLTVPDDAFAVGIVATNQLRKDYGLAFRTIVEMRKQRKVFVWIHTDVIEKHWSTWALVKDYGLMDHSITVTVLRMPDETITWLYSAMDVTLGIGIAEGFGYPIFESLSCGVPCIHGNDGGAPEHMPPHMLVEPVTYRVDGPYNFHRNVYSPVDWADKALAAKKTDWEFPKHLDWNELWPRWQEWFSKGLK